MAEVNGVTDKLRDGARKNEDEMIKAEGERRQRAVPGLVLRRTAVFVPRTKQVLVGRDRDQEWPPVQTIIAPTIKFEAF